MAQSKTLSAMESLANTVLGLFIAWVTALIVFPLFGYKITKCDAFSINIVFYIVSFGRSYLLRRLFNKKETK
jgi:hypothetical protein